MHRSESKTKMSGEILEEQGLEINPDLNLSQLKFLLTQDSHTNDEQTKDELMKGIKLNSEYDHDFAIPPNFRIRQSCIFCVSCCCSTDSALQLAF